MSYKMWLGLALLERGIELETLHQPRVRCSALALPASSFSLWGLGFGGLGFRVWGLGVGGGGESMSSSSIAVRIRISGLFCLFPQHHTFPLNPGNTENSSLKLCKQAEQLLETNRGPPTPTSKGGAKRVSGV